MKAQNDVPAISEEVPWHTAHHLRLLYQAFGNVKAAIGVPGTTVENVTNVNNTVAGGGTSVVGLGGVNNQSETLPTPSGRSDSGILIIFNDASPALSRWTLPYRFL